MKKNHKHTELSNVECANKNCAKVNGREGVARRRIKQSVVDRMGTDRPLCCYPCQQYMKGNRGAKVMKAGR